jgi:hypothetical protein
MYAMLEIKNMLQIVLLRRSAQKRDREQNRSDNRSVTINTPGSENDEQMERVEVQILPQDDNWGDNTTNNILIINHDDITEILLKLESGVKHNNPTDYHRYI